MRGNRTGVVYIDDETVNGMADTFHTSQNEALPHESLRNRKQHTLRNIFTLTLPQRQICDSKQQHLRNIPKTYLPTLYTNFLIAILWIHAIIRKTSKLKLLRRVVQKCEQEEQMEVE